MNLNEDNFVFSGVGNPKHQSAVQKRQVKSPIQKERERSQFKSRLEEEIEDNIKSRSIKGKEPRGSRTVKKEGKDLIGEGGNSRAQTNNKKNWKSDIDRSESVNIADWKERYFCYSKY